MSSFLSMYRRRYIVLTKRGARPTEASCRPIVCSVNLRRLGRISPVEPATRRTLNANLNRKIHMLDIIIGLISGAVGGNVAGAAMKENSLGTIGNSIAGIVGGGAGAGILQALGIGVAGGGGADLQSIISSVAGGGVGGAVVMAVVGLIKKSMGKS